MQIQFFSEAIGFIARYIIKMQLIPFAVTSQGSAPIEAHQVIGANVQGATCYLKV
jgi:hypothetical protein